MSKSAPETGRSEDETIAGVSSGTHENVNSGRATIWKKIIAFVNAFDTSRYTPYDYLSERVSRLEREIERFERTRIDSASREEEVSR